MTLSHAQLRCSPGHFATAVGVVTVEATARAMSTEASGTMHASVVMIRERAAGLGRGALVATLPAANAPA